MVLVTIATDWTLIGLAPGYLDFNVWIEKGGEVEAGGESGAEDED